MDNQNNVEQISAKSMEQATFVFYGSLKHYEPRCARSQAKIDGSVFSKLLRLN